MTTPKKNARLVNSLDERLERYQEWKIPASLGWCPFSARSLGFKFMGHPFPIRDRFVGHLHNGATPDQ
jgi:hypothetical protein